MAKLFASYALILYLSFMMQCSSGNGHHNQEKANLVENHSHAYNPVSNSMDYDTYLVARVGFFTRDDLHVGKTMPIQFFTRDPSSLPPSLLREEADRIPFSLNEFQHLLKLFSFSQGSHEAKLVEDTLQKCQTEPIIGEKKTCATSKESLVEFVSSILGGQNGVDFRALKTTHLGKPSSIFQNYTFLYVEEVNSPSAVGCHIMDYPYVVYLCHSQTSKVYQILLAGREDRDVALNAVAVCHIDTSHWAANHISFRFLGIKPGTAPVCHFLGPHSLVWVPN